MGENSVKVDGHPSTSQVMGCGQNGTNFFWRRHDVSNETQHAILNEHLLPWEAASLGFQLAAKQDLVQPRSCSRWKAELDPTEPIRIFRENKQGSNALAPRAMVQGNHERGM